MKRSLVSLVVVIVAAGLVMAGCGQAAPAPTPTKAPVAPTKAAEPTKAPAPAPTKAAEPTKASLAPTAAPPTAAPAKKLDYPEKGKTITIIVPPAPGGSVDVGARLLASALEKDLGVPVQVVNKPGGGNQVGTTEIALAKPDGYTLGMNGLPSMNTLYLDPDRKAVFNRKSFQAIAQTLGDPVAASVLPGSPYKTLKDLLDAAKAKPEGVKVSTAGVLGVLNMAALLTEKAAGVKFSIVVFDGGNPAKIALLGGHVDASFNTSSEVLPEFRSGALRVLGLMDTVESKFFPGLKTFESQGYKTYMTSYHGLFASAGIPMEVVKVLAGAVKKATEDAQFVNRMSDMGLAPRYANDVEFGAVWDRMDADLKPLVEAEVASRKK